MKMKRLISLLLVLAISVSVFTITVGADGFETATLNSNGTVSVKMTRRGDIKIPNIKTAIRVENPHYYTLYILLKKGELVSIDPETLKSTKITLLSDIENIYTVFIDDEIRFKVALTKDGNLYACNDNYTKKRLLLKNVTTVCADYVLTKSGSLYKLGYTRGKGDYIEDDEGWTVFSPNVTRVTVKKKLKNVQSLFHNKDANGGNGMNFAVTNSNTYSLHDFDSFYPIGKLKGVTDVKYETWQMFYYMTGEYIVKFERSDGQIYDCDLSTGKLTKGEKHEILSLSLTEAVKQGLVTASLSETTSNVKVSVLNIKNLTNDTLKLQLQGFSNRKETIMSSKVITLNPYDSYRTSIQLIN